MTPGYYQKIGNAIRPETIQIARSFLTANMPEHSPHGMFPLGVRLSPALWVLPRALAPILRTFLGRDLFMHMPPTARFVPPGAKHVLVPPHQDSSYNGHMTDFLTVWVPLTPITRLSGGVAFYPAAAAAPVEKDPGSVWLTGIDVSRHAAVTFDMAPGDVLIFDKHVVHSSLPNESDSVRLSVDMRFWGSGNASTKHYLDMQTWKVHSP